MPQEGYCASYSASNRSYVSTGNSASCGFTDLGLEPTQRKTYPNLSVMALDVLSIPAMSAEPERLFSSAAITITDRRNRLGIESIQAIECLKSWLAKNMVDTESLGPAITDEVLQGLSVTDG